MNRTIKFRAWDKVSEEMLFLSDDDCVHISTKGFTWLKGFNEKMVADQGTAVLMQFTGLKDKNGKEIYEGDVCLFGNDKTHISYDENLCAFRVFSVNSVRKAWLVEDGFGITSFDEDMQKKEIEVIGNIYENKGLLDK